MFYFLNYIPIQLAQLFQHPVNDPCLMEEHSQNLRRPEKPRQPEVEQNSLQQLPMLGTHHNPSPMEDFRFILFYSELEQMEIEGLSMRKITFARIHFKMNYRAGPSHPGRSDGSTVLCVTTAVGTSVTQNTECLTWWWVPVTHQADGLTAG